MFDLGNDFHRGHANKLSASRRMVNAAAPRRSVQLAVGSVQLLRHLQCLPFPPVT
jgi:hypothetical protein